jgi:hypothetical protein
VTATDPKTGLNGQGVYKVTIVAPGPQIAVTPITGTHGKAVSGTITLSDANATSLSLSITGAPVGMTFTPKGLVITVNWASPVTGKYTLAISVTDSAKLTSTAIFAGHYQLKAAAARTLAAISRWAQTAKTAGTPAGRPPQR